MRKTYAYLIFYVELKFPECLSSREIAQSGEFQVVRVPRAFFHCNCLIRYPGLLLRRIEIHAKLKIDWKPFPICSRPFSISGNVIFRNEELSLRVLPLIIIMEIGLNLSKF